jgi:hypothetical protein
VSPSSRGGIGPDTSELIACEDLAVSKAFFDRTRDWADREAMQEARTLDVAAVAGVLARLLSLRLQNVG